MVDWGMVEWLILGAISVWGIAIIVILWFVAVYLRYIWVNSAVLIEHQAKIYMILENSLEARW